MAKLTAAVGRPSTVSTPEAFEMLGISESLGYRQIREGTFPVPVIRMGRIIRVPRAPLERLLGIEDSAATA